MHRKGWGGGSSLASGLAWAVVSKPDPSSHTALTLALLCVGGGTQLSGFSTELVSLLASDLRVSVCRLGRHLKAMAFPGRGPGNCAEGCPVWWCLQGQGTTVCP